MTNPVEPQKESNVAKAVENEALREKLISNKHELPQLDEMLVVVPFKMWLFIASVAFFLVLCIVWLFYGFVFVRIEGKGVLINESGFFTISSYTNGFVSKILVDNGSLVEKNQILCELKTEPKASQDLISITSPYSAHVLAIYVQEEDYVRTGSPLFSLEHHNEKEDKKQIFGYLPIIKGKQVSVNQPVQIELLSINPQEYGYLIGKIIKVSEFPVSSKQLQKLFNNTKLVNYLTEQNATPPQPVMQIVIEIEQNKDGTYKWSSHKNPPIPITSGMVCNFRIIAEKIRPIYYLIPLEQWKESIWQDKNS